MRKLTILLAMAALAVSSGCSNCCCIGRARNWFHKGSPCGTTVAPAVLGAPLAMGTPIATPVAAPVAQPMFAAPAAPAPVYIEQPSACVPCVPCCDPCANPCADPCAGGATMGYMGGYAGDGACCDGSSSMPMEMAPGATITVPQGTITPSPGGDQ